ncbi:EAL domain-containing protein [Thiocapsa sp.]|uniref:EAL domain-containing protein n=1 Tax=Thiocapsa sp. TaxID=2024551 RepID=UPI0035933138
MYRAKELSRNRIHVFDVAQDQALLARIDDLKRFREAIEHHELALHYQPKVDLDTGDIVGAEALIRWQHPERGLLLPADFLPLVDGSELEIRPSEWVIAHALDHMTAWHTSGLCLSVSINLPASHLLLPDFADWLAAALSRHPDLIAHSLELEILESPQSRIWTSRSRLSPLSRHWVSTSRSTTSGPAFNRSPISADSRSIR